MEWKKINRPPSPEMERFHNDGLWISEHYAKLRAQYPDQWVGVYDKKVVGASSGTEVVSELKAQGFNVGEVYFKYIYATDTPRVWGSFFRWLPVEQD